MKLLSALFGVLWAAGLLQAQTQSLITTIAGTTLYFEGQGSSGTSAPLGRLVYVTVDPEGRPVFSDPYYNLVIRVENDGTLHVVAGNNVQGLGSTASAGAGGGTSALGGSGGGFSGDNGPATSAALNRPAGLAYDAQGNLYIADAMNNRIRVVNTSGIISTLAGNGVAGFQDGAAAAAQFNYPLDVAVDSSGAVIVNDAGNFSGNHRIRRISQGSVTTIAGNGRNGEGVSPPDNAIATTVGLNDIAGLATDAHGDVYFSDFTTNYVREITPDLRLHTVAGNGSGVAAGMPGEGGPALQAPLFSPSGLAVDASGTIYVSVTNNQLVRKISNGIITTIAGSSAVGFSGDGGLAVLASFQFPSGLAVSAAGIVYVADRDNFRIRQVDTSQNVNSIAGNGKLLFSDDGQQAIYAPLLDPWGVTLDSNGSLLIADTHNNLVRRVDSSGVFSTVAGNGAYADCLAEPCPGDENVPPTQAAIAGPVSTSRDAGGNLLIADLDGQLVREVSATTNLIANFLAPANLTLQGTLSPGSFSPTQTVTDSNRNTYVADLYNGVIWVVRPDQSNSVFKSGLNGPFGLAIDNLNNLYVTEHNGGLVTMIDLQSGAATHIAGGGALQGTNANGQPGTAALLKSPAGIAVDAGHNVYFTDAADNRVWQLTPSGATWIISNIAGNGQSGYSGDGGLATNASLRDPYGVAVDANGTIYIADTGNNRIRSVQSIAPSLTISNSSLTFTVNQGGAVSNAATVNVTASSFGHLAGMLFTASASQSWISVSPAVGATPATLQVTVDPSGLTAQTYNETITISAPGANPPVQTISIAVTVNAPPPPALSLDTNVINAGLNAGGQPLTRQIRVLNSGGQQPQVTAAATMQSGTGWLSVSPGTGVASATAPAAFNVTINPGNLAQGVYTGQIAVTSGGVQVGAVPVNLAVNAKPGILLLSSNALTFTAIMGGAAPLPKAIDMVNTGTGSLTWSASGASLTANTPNWLSLDTSSGSLNTPQTSVSTVNASVNPTGLGIGSYYGQIKIASDSAANSPQFVTVVLNVVAPTTSPGPDVSATALVFAGVQGVNPGSQTIRIANLSSQPLAYGSSRVSDAGDWIVQVPTDASIAAGQTASIVVQPDFTNLAAGTHDGAMTLRFSDGTVRTIAVLAIVAPGSSTGTTSTASRRGTSPRDTSPCAVNPATALVVEITSPPQNSSILANQAATIQATATDCSGNPISSSSTVQAGFTPSSGLPKLFLQNVGGVWTVNWTPLSPVPNVTVTVGAQTVAGLQAKFSETSVTVSVTAVSNAPAASGLANAASFVGQAPVAPGALISIFGTNLADNTVAASQVPLNTSLAGASVTLAGQPLPILYASDKQINAQVPFDLPLSSIQQLSVQRDGALSPQVEFVVGMAQPAIFTEDQSGQGQGVIVFNNTATYADASKPATAGDFLTIYCTGLGPVQGNVQAGTAVTSATPTTATATVTIGGINTNVSYAGLTPGFPGLYQVNVQVPSGVTPGGAVPVIIAISDQTSPDGVTIAVK